MIISIDNKNILNEDYALGAGFSDRGFNNAGFSYEIKPLSFNLTQRGNDGINIERNKAFKFFMGDIVKGISPYDNKKHSGLIKYFYYGKEGNGKMPQLVYVQDFSTENIIPLKPETLKKLQNNSVSNPGELNYFNRNYNKVDRDLQDESPVAEKVQFDFNKELNEEVFKFSLDDLDHIEDYGLKKKSVSSAIKKHQDEIKTDYIVNYQFNKNNVLNALKKYGINEPVLNKYKYLQEDKAFPMFMKTTSDFVYQTTLTSIFDRYNWEKVNDETQYQAIEKFNAMNNTEITSFSTKEKVDESQIDYIIEAMNMVQTYFSIHYIVDLQFSSDRKFFCMTASQKTEQGNYQCAYAFGFIPSMFDPNDFQTEIDPRIKQFKHFLNKGDKYDLNHIDLTNQFSATTLFDKPAFKLEWSYRSYAYDGKDLLQQYEKNYKKQKQTIKTLWDIDIKAKEVYLNNNLYNKYNTLTNNTLKSLMVSYTGEWLAFMYVSNESYKYYSNLYIVDNRDYSIMSKEDYKNLLNV